MTEIFVSGTIPFTFPKVYIVQVQLYLSNYKILAHLSLPSLSLFLVCSLVLAIRLSTLFCSVKALILHAHTTKIEVTEL